MSLIQTVVQMVRERGTATVDDLQPLLPGYTREQIMTALQNGRHERLLTVKRGRGLGPGKGSLPSQYSAVAQPERQPRAASRKLSPSLQDWIEARVIADDEGCWIWQNYTDGSQPQGRYLGRCVKVRRIVWQEHNGAEVPPKSTTVCRLGKAACVTPEHAVVVSRSDRQRGRVQPPTWRAAIADARQRNAKISAEDVAAIRESTETLLVLGARYGISDTHVGRIRNGQAWRDYASPFAGMFSALLASNDSARRAA
jgi:hypothetical protein